MGIHGVSGAAGAYGRIGITPRPAPGHRPESAAGAAGGRSAGQSGDVRSVLTPDELAYFSELEKLGPLTYGPRAGKADAAPAPSLGQRIDVRA